MQITPLTINIGTQPGIDILEIGLFDSSRSLFGLSWVDNQLWFDLFFIRIRPKKEYFNKYLKDYDWEKSNHFTTMF